MRRLCSSALVFAIALSPAGLFAQSGTVTPGSSGTVSYSYGGVPVPIGGQPGTTVSAVNVFVPRALTIQNLKVTVDVDYPTVSNLTVFLIAPQGTRRRLVERSCASGGSLSGITFDDNAGFNFSDACPTVSGGSFKSIEPLSGLQGQNSIGNWTLVVENSGSTDALGWVRSATIAVTGNQMTGPVSSASGVFSAASRQGDGVAPGELVDIIGSGLGPAGGASAPSGGAFPTALSGTEVMIGGVPAAIKFASPLGLRVQVPFGVFTTGSTDLQTTVPFGVRAQVPEGVFTTGSTEMVISVNGVTSTTIPLTVFTVKPGVFTRDPSGKGPAMALNADGSPNTAENPAAPGSNIAIYATGLGEISPPIAAGQVPPDSPLSNTTATVTAVIDGESAPVQFAGAAPRLPGQYLVNIQVPQGVTSGLKNLTIYADGTPSQSGVQIWVQ